MYFINRVEAGKQLTEKLLKYKHDNCTLVALSDGATVIAAQSATVLHSPIVMLLSESINAPGESVAVANINQAGNYGYNSVYSAGQVDEFNMEYRQIFEQSKLEKLSKMHRLLGKLGVIRPDLLRGRTVILIADGLGDASSIDSAMLYLKSIKVKKLIIATPFASVDVVDRMHLLADEIACLNVIQNFMGVNHYYEDNLIPSHETVVKTIQNMVKIWEK
jgi:predicted phosphoribosyltransferase